MNAKRAIYIGPQLCRPFAAEADAFLNYGMTGYYMRDDLGKHFFVADGPANLNISHNVRKADVYVTEA